MKYVPTDMHAISNNKLLSCKHAVAVIAIPRRHAGGNEQYLAFGGRGQASESEASCRRAGHST